MLALSGQEKLDVVKIILIENVHRGLCGAALASERLVEVNVILVLYFCHPMTREEHTFHLRFFVAVAKLLLDRRCPIIFHAQLAVLAYAIIGIIQTFVAWNTMATSCFHAFLLSVHKRPGHRFV